jgi:phosphoglycerate dehydrogenase-like enzyme
MEGRGFVKAVLQYRATAGFRQQIAALESQWLRVTIIDETDKETFDREMRDTEVLLHVLEPTTATIIQRAPKLRLIQKLGIGVDTIDLDAARSRGVAVCNMPGTNTRAVAELALLLMLATLRRLTQLDARTRAGSGWSLDPVLLDSLGELGGRTVGLVGFGAVGKCLVPMLQGMGARVMYADVVAAADSAATFVPFQELLSTSDVVSLHVPLTSSTARMMNAEAFASMKPGAIVINTARGGLIDYQALHAALVSGRLRGAGLDVFEAEPVNPTQPILELPNVIVTPHLPVPAETLGRSRGLPRTAAGCATARCPTASSEMCLCGRPETGASGREIPCQTSAQSGACCMLGNGAARTTKLRTSWPGTVRRLARGH